MNTFLVIDDSAVTRRTICLLLEKYSDRVIEAANGREALWALESHPETSVAFVDWNMPVMTGIDFVRRARHLKAVPQLKLVMVTAENEMNRITEALDSGVDEYIMLPLSVDVFREKLALLGIHPRQPDSK